MNLTSKQFRELREAYGFTQALGLSYHERFCDECLQRARVLYEDRPKKTPGRQVMCASCIVRVFSFGSNGS